MTPVKEGLSETSGKIEVGTIRQEISNLRRQVADGQYKPARVNRRRIYVQVLKRVAEAKTPEDYAGARELCRELLLGETLEIPD